MRRAGTTCGPGSRSRPRIPRRVVDAARAHRLPVALHAEPHCGLGGGALAAGYAAPSADHLDHVSQGSIEAMVEAGTVAVLLAGAFYAQRIGFNPLHPLVRRGESVVERRGRGRRGPIAVQCPQVAPGPHGGRERHMAETDLRDRFPPVWSQDGLHACMAFVLSDAIWWEWRRTDPAARFQPSTLFLYYNARQRAGHQNHNIPVRPSDAIGAVGEFGICPEALWPYQIGIFRDRPTSRAYAAARQHTGVIFEDQAQDLDALRGCLDAGNPFYFCLRLFPSNCSDFEHGEIASTGRVDTPAGGERPVRNHALLAVGYDDTASVVIARNTFGREWGEDGHLLVPYDYLLDPQMAYSFGRVRRPGHFQIARP